MIISRGRRYIFVHIPKTGGSSLSLALESRAMKDDLLIGDTPKATRRRRRLKALQPRGRLWKHATLADIEGIVSPAEMAEFFTFTLVRNPWDRVVSYYAWLREQRFDHPDVSRAQQVDFPGFLADPGVQRRLSAQSAADYMRDTAGVEQASAYIRLEHFDEDAQPLWQHLGFALELPHINRSTRPSDYRAWYDDDTRGLVGRLCAADIARFAYRF